MKHLNLARLRALLLVPVLALFAMLSVPATAQDEVSDQLFLMQEIVVDNDKAAQHREALLNLIALAKEHDYGRPIYAASSNNTLLLAHPLAGYGDVNNMFADRNALAEKGGEAFAEAFGAWEDSWHSERTYFLRDIGALAYLPEGEGVAQNMYFKMSTIRARSGSTDAPAALFARFRSMVAEAELPHVMRFQRGGFGTEYGTSFVFYFGKDEIDLEMKEAAQDALFSGTPEAAEMFQTFVSAIKSDQPADRVFRIRPEYTYVPAQ